MFRKVCVLGFSVFILFSSCVSMIKFEEMGNADLPLPEILDQPFTESNSTENEGIEFDPAVISSARKYYFRIGDNVFTTTSAAEDKNPLFIAKDNTALYSLYFQLWQSKKLTRKETPGYPVLLAGRKDFEEAFPASIFKNELGKKVIKPGDSWDYYSIVQEPQGKLEGGLMGFKVITLYSSRYYFSGIIDKDGKRYAVIDNEDSIISIEFSANDGASNMYCHTGKVQYAYDYRNKRIDEILFSGKANMYNNGALVNPVVILGDSELLSEYRDLKGFSDLTNAFVNSGSVLGTVGQFIVTAKSIKIIDQVTAAFENIPEELLPVICEIILHSKTYPIQCKEDLLEYSIYSGI